MTSKEWHTVNGTLFGFPELPPREEVDPAVYAKWAAERQAILDAAEKVEFKPPPKRRRGFKGPKPGNGEFTPNPGDPGSVLEVDNKRFEVWSEAPLWGGRKGVWAVCDGRYYVLNNLGHCAEVTAHGDVVAAAT